MRGDLGRHHHRNPTQLWRDCRSSATVMRRRAGHNAVARGRYTSR
ncbi:hypothetical protein MPS_3999 [Mycobacterium pseudoshottsii JCM 15466]|nr:hypothetical protein MMSP_0879 [Mycobacterium sp. 012931]EPQ72051.1 hypothetical protein MMEU_3433 [Mycobacterium marinum str. Europe]EPQ78965.1 hypothetical protein MMMB2_3628 [Mycobacterium marinum MB2]GAQ38095.1 hypothetical protein MPS_3999 [Mycobacterium pseudoshottsii JCM 15466]